MNGFLSPGGSSLWKNVNECKEGIDCIFIGPPNNGTGGGVCSSGPADDDGPGHQEQKVCGREIRYWEYRTKDVERTTVALIVL